MECTILKADMFIIDRRRQYIKQLTYRSLIIRKSGLHVHNPWLSLDPFFRLIKTSALFQPLWWTNGDYYHSQIAQCFCRQVLKASEATKRICVLCKGLKLLKCEYQTLTTWILMRAQDLTNSLDIRETTLHKMVQFSICLRTTIPDTVDEEMADCPPTTD